jgi:poly-gamma-glutamate capsule biosynthesis protein CapA/YwtB (metallophosphatase superfamily)
MSMARALVILGLFAFVLLAGVLLFGSGEAAPAGAVPPAPAENILRLRLLAVGDINLGRAVGQELLKGDTLYPFAGIGDSLQAYDLVFGNLESCLSDQNGETQSPGSNLIFTGPPEGAVALRRAGFDIVATANNHALDYGLAGWGQTMENLERAGVAFAGTSRNPSDLPGPVILERNGIRIAFLACTDIMNRPGEGWKQYVAAADSGVLAKVRQARESADLVVLSYHGGEEYSEKPTQRTIDFARAAVDAGADLFLGHHPHVPYGIERWRGGLIIHSLGNFVFRQPARFWTQRSYALSAGVVKDSRGTRIEEYAVIPLLAGFRPAFALSTADQESVYQRVFALSSTEVTELVR